jgi:hypothetical protein
LLTANKTKRVIQNLIVYLLLLFVYFLGVYPAFTIIFFLAKQKDLRCNWARYFGGDVYSYHATKLTHKPKEKQKIIQIHSTILKVTNKEGLLSITMSK